MAQIGLEDNSRAAPKAQDVLSSVIPTVTNECLTYSYTDDHRRINLASVVRGCAYHDYPKGWWLPPMRTTLLAADMLALLPH